MPTRAEEIRARQQVIKSDLDALETKLKESPPEDELEQIGLRSEVLLDEFDKLAEELKPWAEREQRLAAVRSAMSQEASREETQPEPEHRTGPDVFARTKRDPYADLDSVRTGITAASEVRARALGAIEQYANRSDHWALSSDGAEQATKLVEKTGPRFGTAVARQMLITGSPEYLSAFESYLTDPGGFSSRAALSLTPANGGYLVPFTLDPTIILTNNGSANPYRQFATIKTTATNDWNGVTSAGVSAEWTAEGIEAADASPTVGQLKITPQKADAYLFGSYEVIGDSDIAQQLPELLADAKDRLEESAFAVGTGSGQPFGIMGRGTTLAAATGTAASGPTAASAYSLMGGLAARWRGSAGAERVAGEPDHHQHPAQRGVVQRLHHVDRQRQRAGADAARQAAARVHLRRRDVRQRQQGAGVRRHAAVLHRRPGRHVRRLRQHRPRR
jgi:hypothetical protein